MLINISYNDPKIKSKIKSLVGSPYSFFERLKAIAFIVKSLPFFKLNIFKGESNIYSLHIDQHNIKVEVKNKTDFNFFKKIQNLKISN